MNCPFSVWSGGTGLVQRCLSDPGSEGCAGSMTSAICHIGEHFHTHQLHFTTASSFTAFCIISKALFNSECVFL